MRNSAQFRTTLGFDHG